MWSDERYLEHVKLKIEDFKNNNPTSSEPVMLFKYVDYDEEYIFNDDNWNGCDLLRKFLLEEVYSKGVKIKKNIGATHLTCDCCPEDDDWTAYILLEKSVNMYDLYTLSWYKRRGRTESILKNGKPISLTDYVNLLNLLKIED